MDGNLCVLIGKEDFVFVFVRSLLPSSRMLIHRPHISNLREHLLLPIFQCSGIDLLANIASLVVKGGVAYRKVMMLLNIRSELSDEDVPSFVIVN